ncbi:MAG: ABC transporter substrate-binding protein [Spirochaetes bacterium]|nr:ABC transporter substrate-binding protein [Spirochaetota bacterium]
MVKLKMIILLILLIPSSLFSEKTYLDSNKERVRFKEPPEKVIVTSPEVQEIFAELNVQDRIIANVQYCDFPEELKKLPKVGDFKDPNIEKIMKLEPDLVILTDHVQGGTVATLSKLKIKVFTVYIKSINELKYFIKVFGKMFEKIRTAKDLIKKIDQELKQLKIPVPSQKKVVFPLLWSQPLMTAGSGTLIDHIIQVAGGINLSGEAHRAGKGYYTINKEFLLDHKPDYILVCDPKVEVKENLKFLFKKYKDISIITNIHPDLLTRGGPRLIQGIKQLNRIIYKE